MHTRRRRQSTPGRARRRQRHINTCTHTHQPRPVACLSSSLCLSIYLVCFFSFPYFLFSSSSRRSSFTLVQPFRSPSMFLFHAHTAFYRETHSRRDTRVHVLEPLRRGEFPRGPFLGSRSKEFRASTPVESRSSAPGSLAVPAYYSRESSRTARSLVHSVPGAVGCGNPPVLCLLLLSYALCLSLALFLFRPLLYLSLCLCVSFSFSAFSVAPLSSLPFFLLGSVGLSRSLARTRFSLSRSGLPLLYRKSTRSEIDSH